MREIQKTFDKILMDSQLITKDSLNTDPIFKNWSKNKSRFLEAFGEQLIYEFPTPISFEVDEERQNRLADSFIKKVFHQQKKYPNGTFFDFIRLNANSFLTNHTEKDFNYADIHIKKGEKISKSFKYFFTDEKLVRELQDLYSTYQTQKTLTGKLCLSIHPLDYISISNNAHGWRSCHALDGEYCAGNLNYMQDTTTIVAYIKSDKDMQIEGFPEDVLWNSKKWRMLIHIDEKRNMALYSKQYPFFVEPMIVKVHRLLKDLKLLSWDAIIRKTATQLSFKGIWDTDYEEVLNIPDNTVDISEDRLLYLPYSGIKKINKFVDRNKFKLYYNDILNSSDYYPYVGFTPMDWNLGKVKIGEDSKCICCGKRKITNSDIMLCSRCGIKYTLLDSERFKTCIICNEKRFDLESEKNIITGYLEKDIAVTNVLKMYKVGVFMAARGQIAKNYIGNKIIEIFKRDFIKVEDKKIYLLADDGDNGRVQIAISMTCPKDQDNIVINTEEDGFTQEERDEVNALLTRLGL